MSQCAATFSIFDTCIATAITDVGLIPQPEEILRPRAGTGVWNGSNIVNLVDQDGFRAPILWSYYKAMKWFPRYKAFPFVFDVNVSDVRLAFDQVLPTILTDPSTIPQGRRNLSDEVSLAGLENLVQSPLCFNDSLEFMKLEEGTKFFYEALLAGVRERFFTNELDFNMLELHLGYEDEIPVRLEDGNLRLVERLLKLSGADVRLNTIVQKIEDASSFGYEGSLITSFSTTGSSPIVERFDNVVLATSLSRGNITFEPTLQDLPGLVQEYRDSVVTHFTTSSELDPLSFNYTDTMRTY